MSRNILNELSVLSDATNKIIHECRQEYPQLPDWFDLFKQKARDISNGHASSTNALPDCLGFLIGETKKFCTRVSTVLLQEKGRLHTKKTTPRKPPRRTRILDGKRASQKSVSKSPEVQITKPADASSEEIRTPVNKTDLNQTFKKPTPVDEVFTPIRNEISETKRTSDRLRLSDTNPPESSSGRLRTNSVKTPVTPLKTKEPSLVKKESSLVNKESSLVKKESSLVQKEEIVSEEPQKTITSKELKTEKKRKREVKVVKPKETKERSEKKPKLSPKKVVEKLPKDTKKNDTSARTTRAKKHEDRVEKTRQLRTRCESKQSSYKRVIEKLPDTSNKNSEIKKPNTNTGQRQSRGSASKIKSKTTRATTNRNLTKTNTREKQSEMNKTFISTAEKVAPKTEVTTGGTKIKTVAIVHMVPPSPAKMYVKIYGKDNKPPTPAILKQTKLTSIAHPATGTPGKRPLPGVGINTPAKKLHPGTDRSSPSKKLNPATNTPVNAKLPATKQSYELTPEQSSFVSYDVSEIKDSDDDEEEISGKRIPPWATGVRLRNALLHQHYNPVDTEELFGEVPPVDLEVIFGVKKKNYTKRTSSAVWHSPAEFTQIT